MGCLAFLVLHALKQLNLSYDTYIFCLLLSLDSATWFRLWVWRCSRR